MKTILCALLTLPWVVASAAPDSSHVATIQTLQGRTYRQCKILQRDADGIAFSHQKGMARVLFSDLPMSTRNALGYNAKAAAALDLSRKQQREEKLQAQRQQQKRLAEQQAARMAMLRQYALWQQQMAMAGYGYAYPAPFPGPVPAVGFAAPGFGWGGWGHGHGHQHGSRNRGWEGVGIGTMVPGTDGVYIPQSGGHIFTGLPGVHYSPTLGYYNPGYYAPPARRALGTFGVVPGLAAPSPPAVVPGVRIHGSAAVPAGR